MNFSEGFRVYVDGKELPNVNAMQITVDRNSKELEHNKATLFYDNRVLTVGLECVRFESNA